MESHMRCTEMRQNGPLWSPWHFLHLSRVTNMIFFWITWTLEWEYLGVVGLHMRCTKMNQNQPKWTKVDARTTEEKFVSSMCCNAIVTIFVAFWCISQATPRSYMSWSDSYPLPSVHLIQKKIIFDIQDKFETVCYTMLWRPFWSIFIRFGAFWCTSYATPWPLRDFYWLFSPFKCPPNLEKYLVSHLGQIWNCLLYHAMVSILVHIGPFWWYLVHLMCDPMTPRWLVLTPIPFQMSM